MGSHSASPSASSKIDRVQKGRIEKSTPGPKSGTETCLLAAIEQDALRASENAYLNTLRESYKEQFLALEHASKTIEANVRAEQEDMIATLKTMHKANLAKVESTLKEEHNVALTSAVQTAKVESANKIMALEKRVKDLEEASKKKQKLFEDLATTYNKLKTQLDTSNWVRLTSQYRSSKHIHFQRRHAKFHEVLEEIITERWKKNKRPDVPLSARINGGVLIAGANIEKTLHELQIKDDDTLVLVQTTVIDVSD